MRCSKELGSVPSWCWRLRDSGTSLSLAGSREDAQTWFDESWDVKTLSNSPEPTSVSNETCIIQHALIDGNGILLTADAGPQALMEAAQYAHTVGRLSPPYTSPLSLI